MRVLVISSSVLGTIGGVEHFVRVLQEAAQRRPSAGVEFDFPSAACTNRLFEATAGEVCEVLQTLFTPFVRERGIAVVHSHNLSGAHLLALDRWSHASGIPHLTTIHDVPSTGFDRRAVVAIPNTRVATQSAFNARLLEELTPAPVMTLPVGIAFEDFSVLPPPDERCVALPARVDPAKSIVEAVTALDRLGIEDGPVRLLLSDLRRPAFDKEDSYVDEVLEAVERSPGVQVDFVHDDDGLAGLYQQCSAVLCLPKYDEGFGLTALEALAAGRPVIVTPRGGMKEWLPSLPGVMALGGIGGLGTAVREVLASRLEWHRAALRGRAIVEPQYSIETVLDAHRRVYSEMCGSASASIRSRDRQAAS